MGSWIAAIGALVAASTGMVGVGAHHPPQHHRAPSAYTKPSPMPSCMPGMHMAGCGSTPTQGGGSTGTVDRVVVPLQTMPAGGVTLRVDSQTGRIAAQLNMWGLAPGTQHRVALYDDGGQNLAFTFPDVTVDEVGRLQQTVFSYEQALQGLPDDLSFQIDLDPTQGGGTGASQVVAAADGGTPHGGGRVTLQFRSAISQSGSALLDYDPATRKLTVSVQVSGLVPGSLHAAHIHAGSCLDQGGVIFGLPDLVANSEGYASEQTTISGVPSPPPAGGWYVNVHDGTMNDIFQNGQPGPLYQPLVCGNVQPPPPRF
jgi:hypothetical protein